MNEQNTERELDESRDEQQLAQSTIPPIPSGLPGNPDTPIKRGRGRPKGSKNKKTLENLQAGGVPAGSSSTTQPGEKRKRGRPPKVPYHLQFTDPSIIHDAIQSQEAAAAALGKAKKPRGRPPKNPKPQPDLQQQQQAALGGSTGGVPLDGQGDEAAGLAYKRMRTDGNE